MDTFKWHKQSEDDILFAIDDWGYHKFACLMKDGKLANILLIKIIQQNHNKL